VETGGLGINLPGLIFYLVNFGVIVLVLGKFLYKPVMKFMHERQEIIRRNIYESNELRMKYEQEVEGLRQRYTESHAKMQQEIEGFKSQALKEVDDLRSRAQEDRRQILEQARQKAESIISGAESEAEEQILDRVNKILSFALHSSMSPEKVISKLKTAWRETATRRQP